MTYLNKVPVSMKDPCPNCGVKKWQVTPTTVSERMEKHIGRHWLAICENCEKEYVVFTYKQEKEMAEEAAKAKAVKPQKSLNPLFGMSYGAGKDRLHSYAMKFETPGPVLTFGIACLRNPCHEAFCPEHSPISLWAGEEGLVDVPPAF